MVHRVESRGLCGGLLLAIDRMSPGMPQSTQRRHYRPADSGVIVASFSLGSELFLAECCLGLMLIKFSSVAVATIAMMPPTLSAICIASPFEMSSSAM